MKLLLIALFLGLFIIQPVMADSCTVKVEAGTAITEKPPAGVVKFRLHLEHMRLEVLRENMLMMDVGETLSESDQKWISNHTSMSHAQAVGDGSHQLMEDLTVAIQDLGGTDVISDDEKASIKKSLIDEQQNIPESIPMFEDNNT